MENKVYYLNNKNIYITSNEEIKVGDWVIEFQKGDDIGEVHFINSEYVIASDIQKKIILTTDELYIHNDLIPKEYNPFPQYIQKIDYEFLEWFVKNPSCKSVKIDLVPINEFNSEITVGGYGFDKFIYKIIIPQEEPKQLTDLEIAMKLEEIDREEYQSVKDFSRGAKWQAKRMYSEEEVETIAKDAYNMGKNNILIGVFNKWFEQYKKK
jgi:hypothetical protein